MERTNLFNRVCGRKAQTAANRIGWLAAMTALVFGLVTGCQYESNALGSAGKSLALSKGAVGEPAATLGPVSISKLAEFLEDLPENEDDDPYDILIDAVNISDNNNWAAINDAVASTQAGGKYVIINISLCSATDNTIYGYNTPTGNDMNIIQNNQYIKGVVLPASLQVIGDLSFYQCVYLTSITILGNVTSIGEGAFYQCTSLASVSIPSSVKGLKMHAFGYCTGLTSVTLSEGLIDIGIMAFHQAAMTSISIPASTTTLEMQAFLECNALATVVFVGSDTVLNRDDIFPYGKSLRTAADATDPPYDADSGTYTLSGGVWTKQ